MAMEKRWIKIGMSLEADKKVHAISEFLAHKKSACDYFTDHCRSSVDCLFDYIPSLMLRRVTVGSLHSVWAWALREGKRRGDDCIVEFCTVFSVDEQSQIPYFGTAMNKVGWLFEEQNEDGDTFIVFPNLLADNFLEHEWPAEKKRESSRKSSKKYRKNVTQESSQGDSSVTAPSSDRDAKVTTKKENKKEKLNTTKQNPFELCQSNGERKPPKRDSDFDSTVHFEEQIDGKPTLSARSAAREEKPTGDKAEKNEALRSDPTDASADVDLNAEFEEIWKLIPPSKKVKKKLARGSYRFKRHRWSYEYLYERTKSYYGQKNIQIKYLTDPNRFFHDERFTDDDNSMISKEEINEQKREEQRVNKEQADAERKKADDEMQQMRIVLSELDEHELAEGVNRAAEKNKRIKVALLEKPIDEWSKMQVRCVYWALEDMGAFSV